jgi:hypothetical protein
MFFIFFIFFYFIEMEERVRKRATPSPPLVVGQTFEPLIEVMTRQQQPRDDLAHMSRSRFAVSQFTSILVTLLTCLSIVIVSLSKMENLQDFLTGPCGLMNIILRQLNSSMYNASCSPTPPPPPPPDQPINEYE